MYLFVIWLVQWWKQCYFWKNVLTIIFEIKKKENNSHTSSFDTFIRCQYKKPLFRSSRPEALCKKGVLRNFAKFTEKYLCQALGLQFIKKETLVQVFSYEFFKISKNTFSHRTTSSGCFWLLMTPYQWHNFEFRKKYVPPLTKFSEL